MLDFVIFAVTVVVVLLIAVIYMYPSSKRITTIPGLDSTSAQDGNLVDIQRAGSLHQFLQQQHKDLGPIVSFWIGEGFVVSIASPGLFKQHAAVFDRPGELFSIMLPVFGEKSLYFLNGAEGRARRQLYDKSLHHENLNQYSEILGKISSDMTTKWGTVVKDEHVSLQQYMSAFSIKAVLQCVMGPFFKEDKEVLTFMHSFDQVWLELEHRIQDPEIPADDSPRGKAFKSAVEDMRAVIVRVLEHRAKHRKGNGEDLIVDHILAAHKNDTNAQVGDCLTYLVCGVSRTSSLLTWCLYFVASHPKVQDKLYTELLHEYKAGDFSPASVFKIRYLREVLDETLRCAVIVPFSARCQDFDTEIGGHKIPKDTDVIQALGVVMHDETLFPIPNKFDPDRFSTKNSAHRDTLAYCPFGFGGRRLCPAKDLTYMAASILVANLVRNFSLSLVDGQVVSPYYGLVTRPEDEVWVTITKRK
ncbi:hypothetical protein ACOMHN_038845 [Nucella lapillus]